MLCSTAFAVLGQSEAVALGMPGLPIMALPHPLNSLPAEKAKSIAEAALDEVISVLTAPGDGLVAHYKGRYLSGARPKSVTPPEQSDGQCESGLCEIP